MDDWTYPYPDVDPPDTQPALPDDDGRLIEDPRVRAHQAEAARVAELEQSEALAAINPPTDADVPLTFATLLGAALTF